MTEQSRRPHPRPLAIEALPELPTRIGMAGGMRHAEVGGSSCTQSGIVIATIAFGFNER